MSASDTGVYYDERRRKWLYQPEPMDAEECENVACALGRDGWADDLFAAADRICQREAEAEAEAGVRPGLRFVLIDKEAVR